MKKNEIRLYGSIGDKAAECDSNSIADKLKSFNGEPITIRVNSKGGDVFDAHAIKNLLREYPGKKTVYIDGLAASAASYIAIASADELHLKRGSIVMIHPAKSGVSGTSSQIRKMADVLDKLTGQIADEYVLKSNKSKQEILSAMNAETWLSPDECKEFGFNCITEADEAKVYINKADIEAYGYENCPENLIVNSLEEIPTIREVENIIFKNSGLTHQQTKALLAGGYKALTITDKQRDAEKQKAEMAELFEVINKFQKY